LWLGETINSLTIHLSIDAWVVLSLFIKRGYFCLFLVGGGGMKGGAKARKILNPFIRVSVSSLVDITK
jgi:hypothetical protein